MSVINLYISVTGLIYLDIHLLCIVFYVKKIKYFKETINVNIKLGFNFDIYDRPVGTPTFKLLWPRNQNKLLLNATQKTICFYECRGMSIDY